MAVENKLIQHWIEDFARRQPAAPAVVDGERTLTYRELDEQSNQLAWKLKEAGCRRGDRVCLLIERSIRAVVCYIGVLKADCLFAPQDLQSPAARAAAVLDNCEPRVVLVEDRAAELLRGILDTRAVETPFAIGWVGGADGPGDRFTADFRWEDLADRPTTPPEYENEPGDVAQIMFTSGSTGVPKGVTLTHANLRNLVRVAPDCYRLAPTDRMAFYNQLSWDASTLEIVYAIGGGASLHLHPIESVGNLPLLLDFFRNSRITVWFGLPSIMSYLARFKALEDGDFPAMRHLTFGGEVTPTPTLIFWMQKLPHVIFTHVYGPTETTVITTSHQLQECPRDEQEAIPIGVASDGERILILNDELNPVPSGEPGEFFIGGHGVSQGYWRDAEKTAASFPPDPRGAPGDRMYKTGDLGRIDDDGLLYFLGRKDHQIKCRDYRVELGDIEHAFNAVPELRESAIVAIDAAGLAGKTICCAYALLPGRALDSQQIGERLGQTLPEYMIPTRWLELEALPKNAHGKIDRPGLQLLFARKRRPENEED